MYFDIAIGTIYWVIVVNTGAMQVPDFEVYLHTYTLLKILKCFDITGKAGGARHIYCT